MVQIDELSRVLGNYDARIKALEESDKEHKETGRDFRKWKNTLIGAVVVASNVALIVGWLITKIL